MKQNKWFLGLLGVFIGFLLSYLARTIFARYDIQLNWWQHIGLGLVVTFIIGLVVYLIQNAR